MRKDIRGSCIGGVWIILFVVLLAISGCGKPEPDRIEVTPAEKVIAVGETIDFAAVVRSKDGDEMPDATTSWRVVGDAGTIDSNGKFSAVKPGDLEIIASSGEASGKAAIQVTPMALVSLTAQPEKSEAYPGSQMKLKINGLAAGDTPAGYHEVVVSSPTENVVLGSEKLTLSDSGAGQLSFTLPLTPGEALVNLSVGDVKQQVRIQVIPRPIQDIVITADGDTAVVESAVSLTITATDKDGQSAGYNKIALSTSAPEGTLADKTLTLDGEGQGATKAILPAEPGPITITAVAGDIQRSIKITVTPRPVAQIKTSVDTLKAIAESEVTVNVQGVASDGKTAGFNTIGITATSAGTRVSDNTLKLDKDGKAQFTTTLSPKPGKNIIAIRSGQAETDVAIEGTQIVRLTISPQDDVYEIGQHISFAAIGHDAFGNSRPIEPRWSISGENATVAPDGIVTMAAIGDGILFAEYKDVGVGQPYKIVPGRPARLDPTPAELKLKAGARAVFQAGVFNAQDLPISAPIEWQVEGDVGSILTDGTFMATTAGEGAVIAISADARASVPVVVEHGELVDILFDLENTVLTAGKDIMLSAKGVDAFGNTFDIDPQWLLTTSIGEISEQESLFRPLKTGTGEIIAKLGNVLKGVKIEIVPAELSRLAMSPETISMIAGETTQFEVNGYDRFGNDVQVEPEFVISADIGDLATSGKLNVQKSGNAIVTAKVDDLTAKSTVAVAPAEMEIAEITPAGPLMLVAGTAQILNLSGFDAFGNLVKSKGTWEIHPQLGIIDANGVVHPKKVGKGQIKAAITQLATGKTLEVVSEFSIAPGQTTRIDVTPNPLEIIAGEEILFSAVSYDRFENETDVEIIWQVENPDLGTIDAQGRFSGVRAALGNVLAIHGNVVGSAAVSVIPAEVAFLKIIPEDIAIQAGKNIKIQAIIEDKFGNVIDGDVLWQISDGTLATLSAGNVLTGQEAGTGRVIGTFHNLVTTVPLEIKTGPLHVIELTPSEKQLAAGSTLQFKAMGLDAGGNPVSSDFVWSMKEQIGQIDSAGKLMVEKVGTGQIEVSANGVTAAATIDVVPATPANIKLEPEDISITAGESQQISFQVYDAYDNQITDVKYTWTIEKDLGNVSAENIFTARSAGKGHITLAVGEVSAKIAVEVAPAQIATVTIEPAVTTVKAGKQQAFTATGFDAQGNRLDIEPLWSVNGNVGSIDAGGVFQATTVGQGYVLVRMDSATGVAEVTIEPGPAERVAVVPEHIEMQAGDSTRFTATVYDAFGNITPGQLTWSLSDGPILGELSSDAQLNAQKAGQGHVIAAMGAVSGRASFKILPGSVAQIIAETEEIVLTSGQQSEIKTMGMDTHGNQVPIEPSFQIIPANLGRIESKDNLFAAIKAGSGLIKASVGELSAEIPVRVELGELTSISIQLPEV